MRRAALLTATAVLLVTPTVLAFFSGGYFDKPRLIATLVVWALVLLIALVGPSPLPAATGGRVAIAGLALITVWSGVSIAWAPLSDPATDSFVRLLLYLGALVGAAALLREPVGARAVEPALALGALVVIGYGLSERLLPGLIDLAESRKAFGRLEQPITYWNAEGALAAIGFVLCARLAGATDRPRTMRAAAAAAAIPLGLAVYISYSRGAIAAALVGVAVLLATAPTWSQLRAAALALGGGVLAAASGAALPGVASASGALGDRELDGALMLVVLVVLMGGAAFGLRWLTRAEERGSVATGRLRTAPRLPLVAGVALALGLAVLVAGGLAERGRVDLQEQRRGVERLTSIESRRYDYWRVGLDAYAEHPLRGIGAGGFRVVWLRDRPVREGALEIHSLPLEMLVELGVPGLLGLVLMVGGVAAAGGRALERHPELAAGPCAVGTVWLLHASIDWDWQLPAVTLPAIIAAGALLAAGEGAATGRSAGSAA
jgi:O-antigen ligase/polysaccharide polymerase Wzy-like membrane protein